MNKKILKKILAASGVFLVVGFIVVIFPFVKTMITNSIKLKNFSEQLIEAPSPKKAQVLDTYSTCGNLFGNGNGIDFFAAVLLESKEDIDYLYDFYYNLDEEDWVAPKNPRIDNRRPKFKFKIVPVTGVDIDLKYTSSDIYKLRVSYYLFKDTINEKVSYDNLYIAYIIATDYPFKYDLRGM